MDEVISSIGARMAWLSMLRLCLRELAGEEQVGNVPEQRLARRIVEREEALHVLRRLCETHGDMDWNEDLHLVDILEKHLERHLDEREG